MARIDFWIHPESSHFHCGLRLAEKLRDAGHSPRLLCIGNDRPRVAARGLRCKTLMQRHMPPGFREAFHKRATTLTNRQRAQAARQMAADAFAELAGDLARHFAQDPPDLFLADAMDAYTALPALRSGIPAALLSTSLPLQRLGAPAPLCSAMGEPRGWLSKRRAAAAWAWLGLKRRLRVKGTMTPLIRDFVKRFGGAGALRGAPMLYGIDLAIPKLIACPRIFDFERPDDGLTHYIEPLLDLDRAEEPFPWARLAEGQKIVYCAMSTQPGAFPARKARAFFEATTEAFAHRKDLAVVIATGDAAMAEELGHRFPRAIFVRRAPQATLLSRAALAINHAGLNSVKECIWRETPMLAFPLRDDQPGAAARIASHGLGLADSARRATPDRIRAMAEAVEGNPEIAAALSAMRAAFAEAERANLGVTAIEGLLAAGSPSRLAARQEPPAPAGLDIAKQT